MIRFWPIERIDPCNNSPMTPRRKFTSEFGLIVPLDRTVLLEPKALRDSNVNPDLKNYAESCHLYLIGHRPMTCIMPEHTTVEGERITARFISRVNSEEAVVHVSWNHPGLKAGERVDSPWPHNVVRILDAEGRQLLRRNASILLSQAMALLPSVSERGPVDRQFLDLSVDYVGKSFGQAGERGAMTRLSSHSTLQRILTETPREMEIWILLLDSTTYTIVTTLVPVGKRGDAADREDDDRIKRAFDGPMGDAAITDILEGSLIKYFQPPYNVQLKSTFPEPTSKPLSEAYARDLNLIGFELDTSHLSVRLGSSSVPPSFDHAVTFPLHSESERKNMLDFIDDIEVLTRRAAEDPRGGDSASERDASS